MGMQQLMSGRLAWLACRVLFVLLGTLGAAGCMRATPATERVPYVSEAAARGVPVFVGGSGERAAWADVVRAAGGAEVVIVGENHGHPLGLASAAALWDDVLAASDRAALSMEFIERDEQARVDDYLSGVIDETAFRGTTRRTESAYPPGHRKMVEAARAHHRPVVGANAPRRYVRLARVDGYEKLASLSAEQRRLFRIPDRLPGPETKYRKDFDEVMGGPADPAKPGAETESERRSRLDAVFRSQSVWDWTMAESVVRAVESGHAPVVHVVGKFHSDFGGGLMQAMGAMRPGTRMVTVSFVDAAAGALREEDRGRADFVVYVGDGDTR